MVRTISPERWKTYQIAAGFNDDKAHRLYLWNAAVGQSFHFPLQTVEVALRNVLHQALAATFGPDWTQSPACRATLTVDRVNDITKAERRHYGIYKTVPSTPQIVASLSLGFWVSLLRKHYHQSIWATQTSAAFPNLQANETINDVSNTGTSIQNLRNRIFHQEPLLRHNLSVEYAAIIRMLGWICPEMQQWMRQLSSVPKVLRERPR